jgi:uncharacterized membrane protein
MTGAAMLLAAATLAIDGKATGEWLSNIGWIHSRSAAGARDLLRVVASSMITIAALTYSIIVVALQLASSQLGPRLVRNFMRDLGNQIVMGTFIATYVYCLLVMRTIQEEGSASPRLSVVVALLLALTSLGVLIYFLHHAAASIQAPNVIASVSRELHAVIDRLYPDPIGEEAPPPEPAIPSADAFATVHSRRSGYLLRIDDRRLLATASRAGVLIRLDVRPGQFLTASGTLASVAPRERCTPELQRAIVHSCILGSQRTSEQDVEFVLARLIEIALRALSTGHNDVFTASACIDHMCAGLVQLARRRIPSPFRSDAGGALRVIAPGPDRAMLIEEAFGEIVALRPELDMINDATGAALDRLGRALPPHDTAAHAAVERLRSQLASRRPARAALPN